MAAAWARPNRLANCPDDLRVETWILPELGEALLLQTLDDGAILFGPAGALVEPLWLEHLDIIDARDRLRDFVAEVVVPGPADGSLRDRLDDGARIFDGQLLAFNGALRAADAPGVHQVHLERPGAMQLQEPVPLLLVAQREERV